MKFKIDVKDEHYRKVEDMSLSQLLSIICCPNYMFESDDLTYGNTATAFIHDGNVEFHKVMTEKVGKRSTFPPFFCTDLEAGPGTMIHGATEFPSLFSCSVTGNPEYAYEMGKIAALEGRAVGYNWTLGPAVDIVANPDTPTTSNRGAGMSPDEAINFGVAYIKGCQDYGMIATAKHFPGDGFGIYDQHLTTPEIPLTMEEWWNTSGRVYKEVIEAGVMSIMPGHLSFPAFDKPCEENGLYPPATISENLLTNLLKKELGFDGIIISDAVEMVGFSGFMNYYEACAKFIEYGGDILLFAKPDKKMHDNFVEMLNNHVVSLKNIRERAARVLAFKDQINHQFKGLSGTYNIEDHKIMAQKVIDSSIRVVRDRKKILPIKNSKSKRVLHLIVSIPNFKQLELLEAFKPELEKYFKSVEQWVDPGNKKVMDAIENNLFDVIICSVGNDYNFGTNVIRLNGTQSRNLMGGWVHSGVDVLFISHFHPFTHLEYKALMSTVINTNGTVKNTLGILAEKIVGISPLEAWGKECSPRDWTLREWLDRI